MRTLRLLALFPSLESAFQCILGSFGSLNKVVWALMFLYLIFTLVGKALFMQGITNRCRITNTPVSEDSWPIVEGITTLCGQAECELG